MPAATRTKRKTHEAYCPHCFLLVEQKVTGDWPEQPVRCPHCRLLIGPRRGRETPEANPGASPTTLLDWVGRNHDRKTKGADGQDARRTNFLYLDGHVETKHLADTVYPRNEWGEQFYSLTP